MKNGSLSLLPQEPTAAEIKPVSTLKRKRVFPIFELQQCS